MLICGDPVGDNSLIPACNISQKHNLKIPKNNINTVQRQIFPSTFVSMANWNSSLVYVHRTPFSGSTASLRANCAFISTINRRTITSTSISPRWSTTLQDVEWKEPTCFPMSFRTCRQIPVTITTVAWRSRCVPMMPCSSSSKRPGNSRDLFFFLGTSIFFTCLLMLWCRNCRFKHTFTLCSVMWSCFCLNLVRFCDFNTF